MTDLLSISPLETPSVSDIQTGSSPRLSDSDPQEREIAIRDYRLLDEKVRKFDSSPIRTYLELTRKVCGTEWYPSEDKELEIYGQERVTALNLIWKETKFNWSQIYESLNTIMRRLDRELEGLELNAEEVVTVEEMRTKSVEMKEWLKRMELNVAGHRVGIAILEGLIAEKEKCFRELEASADFVARLPGVTSDVVGSHDKDASVRNRGQHCFLLFSDGEIISTKAGADLFLARSLFTVKPAIAGISVKTFRFPEIWDANKSQTYVILGDMVTANALRNKMLALYGLPVEDPGNC